MFFSCIETKIIVVKLSGGLGNQLYQLSNALQLKRRPKKILFLYLYLVGYESHEYPRLKDIGLKGFVVKGRPARMIDKFLRIFRFVFSSLVAIQDESTIEVRSTFIRYVVGLYQVAPSELIRRFFRVKLRIRQITDVNEASLSVHLRLGDYKYNWASTNLGLLDRSYYDRVFKLINLDKIDRVYVYSDGSDREVTAFFSGIDCKIIRNKTDLEDLRSIAKTSKILVCGNSTFSLWAAYLANTREIYVPKIFFLRDSMAQQNTESKYYHHWNRIENKFK
jgi:Glycosyl transferase family 11